MESFLLEMGLPALFFISFLAATLLPVGSEWLLVVLLQQGQPIEIVVLLATAGNFFGACTTFFIGRWGSEFLTKKVLRIEERTQKKAEFLFQKFGFWSLLFSWVPIVGDPLCLVSGVLRLPFSSFFLFVLTGKFARYTVVAFLTLAALS